MVLAYFFHLVYLGDICDEIVKTFPSIGMLSLWYLLPISKHLHYLLFPCDMCDVFDVFEVHLYTMR